MALVDDFKNALASWASGVSVVTARAGELTHGVTVSSFTSLSLQPPLILVCLASRSRLPALVRQAGAFAVSVLAADQAELSAQFARSGREPAADLGAPAHTVAGVPVLAGAAAHLACALEREVEVGDHIILIGQVTEAAARASAEPLLYFRRRYHGIGGPLAPTVELPPEAFLGLQSW